MSLREEDLLLLAFGGGGIALLAAGAGVDLRAPAGFLTMRRLRDEHDVEADQAAEVREAIKTARAAAAQVRPPR